MSITRLPPPFRHLGQKYAFVVVAVIFFSLLVSAGLRSTPSVLIVPLEQAFGWSRSTISWRRRSVFSCMAWRARSPPPPWSTSACAAC